MKATTDRARRRDPQTSFEVAMAIEVRPAKLRASQARVLNMFKLYGDMHDKQLLEYLNDAERNAGLKPMSPSGARSRRNELAKPNMDRLDQMAADKTNDGNTFDDVSPDVQEEARGDLRREGFRSPLWDTGKRALVDGRNVIVWGIAR